MYYGGPTIILRTLLRQKPVRGKTAIGLHVLDHPARR